MKKTILITAAIICVALVYFKGFQNRTYAAYTVKPKFDENNKIKLALGNQTFDLVSYNMSYNIPATKTAPPGYNVVNLAIKTNKIDQATWNWLLNSPQTEKDGSITIYDGETGSALRTITFTGLTGASFNENYSTVNNYNPNNVTNFGLRYKTIGVTIAKN